HHEDRGPSAAADAGARALSGLGAAGGDRRDQPLDAVDRGIDRTALVQLSQSALVFTGPAARRTDDVRTVARTAAGCAYDALPAHARHDLARLQRARDQHLAQRHPLLGVDL